MEDSITLEHDLPVIVMCIKEAAITFFHKHVYAQWRKHMVNHLSFVVMSKGLKLIVVRGLLTKCQVWLLPRVYT